MLALGKSLPYPVSNLANPSSMNKFQHCFVLLFFCLLNSSLFAHNGDLKDSSIFVLKLSQRNVSEVAEQTDVSLCADVTVLSRIVLASERQYPALVSPSSLSHSLSLVGSFFRFCCHAGKEREEASRLACMAGERREMKMKVAGGDRGKEEETTAISSSIDTIFLLSLLLVHASSEIDAIKDSSRIPFSALAICETKMRSTPSTQQRN